MDLVVCWASLSKGFKNVPDREAVSRLYGYHSIQLMKADLVCGNLLDGQPIMDIYWGFSPLSRDFENYRIGFYRRVD